MSSHSEQPIAATIVITVIEPGLASIQGSPSKFIRLTEADVAALKTAHPGLTVLAWAKASLEIELEAAYGDDEHAVYIDLGSKQKDILDAVDRAFDHPDLHDAPQHFASEHTPEDHFTSGS